MRRSVGGPSERSNSPFKLIDTQGMTRDFYLLTDFQPTLILYSFNSKLSIAWISRLNPSQLALRLLNILARNVALDIIQLLFSSRFFSVSKICW